MVHWPATAIIDLVFVPLYGILLIVNVMNVFKHGFSKVAGYISLLIVSARITPTPLHIDVNCSVKIVGDTLLVVTENGSSSSVSVAVWGLILSQLGFLPLIAATNAFIIRWYTPTRPHHPFVVALNLYLGSAHGKPQIQACFVAFRSFASSQSPSSQAQSAPSSPASTPSPETATSTPATISAVPPPSSF